MRYRRLGNKGWVFLFTWSLLAAVLFFTAPNSQGLTLEKDPITSTQTEAKPVPKEKEKEPDVVPATPTFRLPGRFDEWLAKVGLIWKKDDDKEKKGETREKGKNWWQRFFHFF